MPFIHCPFTLVVNESCALSQGAFHVVTTFAPHAVYPWHIHNNIDGQCAVTPGPGAARATIRHMPYIHCTNTLVLKEGCKLPQGQVPVWQQFDHMPYIHGKFPRVLTDSAQSMPCMYPYFRQYGTCLIFIAESQLSWRAVLQSLTGKDT